MQHILFCLLGISCFAAHSTAFTLNDGAYWRDVCSGIHDDLDEKSAVASCTMFILGYQAGAYQQAKVNNQPPLFCRAFNPNTLPKEFVTFIKSNAKYEKMNIFEVLAEFTKKDGSCDLQLVRVNAH